MKKVGFSSTNKKFNQGDEMGLKMKKNPSFEAQCKYFPSTNKVPEFNNFVTKKLEKKPVYVVVNKVRQVCITKCWASPRLKPSNLTANFKTHQLP